jgi:hypothetical protein
VMQALKHAEQLPGVLHVEADAVVAHKADLPVIVASGAELDPRVRR